MKRLLIILMVVLGLAGPAHAALSATEKAEIQELTESIRRLTIAWAYLGQVTMFTTAANRTALINLWAGLLTPTSDLTDAYALLLHVNTAAPGDTSAYATYEATARATLVASAMTKLGTAGTGLTTADGLRLTASGIAAQDASYYTGLTSLQAELTAAETALSGFNTGLSYTSPRDTPWFPRVVTPHGNFLESTRLLHAATVRMIASMTFLQLVYNAAAQGETALTVPFTSGMTSFNRYLQASSELILKFTDVLHTWVDIPISGHCQFSPHHSMARIMEKITQVGSESASMTTPYRGGEHAGAPYRFHMAGTFATDFLEPLRAEMVSRPLTWAKLNAGLAKYFESWQAQDGAMWEIMNFPAGVTLADLRVQAGRTNVSNVPPLCPDTTAPVTVLIAPTDTEVVSQWKTIVATCKDTIDDAAWGVGEKGTLCAKMTVKIDGIVVATITSPPYEYAWDTTLTSNGSHTVQAVGFDAADNQTPTATSTVTVSN